ncbi:MAG: TolC family protein, partial [Reyranella sp.]|nr:TolC family protein [Reyranella sp.]
FDALTLQAASNAENAARLSLDITRRRQVAGDAGVLDVLNAELTYQTAASALVSARVARFSDTAGLFQALGGGWWNRDASGDPNPAQRAVCRPPTNPPKPQPWPDTSPSPQPPPQPASVSAPPPSEPTGSKPSKGFWGSRL